MNLYKKYKSLCLYAVFGILTTVVNILVYNICKEAAGFTTVISNVWAWILAVLFAYFTNRRWVFQSDVDLHNIKGILKELISFFSCRLATGILDTAIMYVSVDRLFLNDTVMKLLSNMLVIVLNYVASRLVVFKKHKTTGQR